MNKIHEFIAAFIPKNIPQKRRLILTDELENHLRDKSDFYRDIGYSEEESIKKAIADFGTDEEMKKSIFNEFEELYSEKSIFAIISFFAVLLMNVLCACSGAWVISADFNAEPSTATALISFAAIFVVCALIAFARIKRYRKMLFAIGLSNVIQFAVILFNFYPQCAAYSLIYNLMYLIERFTPISLGFEFITYDYSFIPAFLTQALPFILAVYCFVISAKIKKGSAKIIENSKKKTVIFCVVFSFAALSTAFLLPTGLAYKENYNPWFDKYYNCITDEADAVFEDISVGGSYNEISNMLTSQGYTTAQKYEKTLSRTELKQFKDSYEKFNFIQGYELWFKTDKVPRGNGFIGIKAENGLITAKAVGNLEKEMYTSERFDGNCFGAENLADNCNTAEMSEYFRGLKKGEDEEEIINKISGNIGVIYTKSFSSENGTEKHYYRIVSGAYVVSDTASPTFYAELYFENEKLTGGTLYNEDRDSVISESIR